MDEKGNVARSFIVKKEVDDDRRVLLVVSAYVPYEGNVLLDRLLSFFPAFA